MTSIVVKLGGHALDDLTSASAVLDDLAHDVAQLINAGVKVAVVHGGGPQIAQLLDRVGIASRFYEGLRITDEETMSYVAMALLLINVQITAALNQAGLRTVGVAGVDGGLFRASALGDPWGRAANTPRVNVETIEALWSSSCTPVVCSLALDENGGLLNCNADTAAGALAGALGARELVLLSDIDQLLADPDDDTTRLAHVTGDQVRALIDSGAAREGMRPKMRAALDALEGGANKVLLANGTRAHALAGSLNSLIPTTEVAP
ncbi:MAG TPA: acetylglutamate kinase [Acidimicrobiales bacterium]|nr:acetylglutamate kinase [Acidimicrobiales bacterium]